MFTVDDLVRRFAVTQQTVLGWIHTGELVAVNVGQTRDRKRPRWRITQAALDAFLATRTATPSPPKQRKRRTASTAEVIEFYPS